MFSTFLDFLCLLLLLFLSFTLSLSRSHSLLFFLSFTLTQSRSHSLSSSSSYIAGISLSVYRSNNNISHLGNCEPAFLSVSSVSARPHAAVGNGWINPPVRRAIRLHWRSLRQLTLHRIKRPVLRFQRHSWMLRWRFPITHRLYVFMNWFWWIHRVYVIRNGERIFWMTLSCNYKPTTGSWYIVF